MDSLKTINSFLRTLMALAVIGALAVAGYFAITTYFASEFEKQAKEQELAGTQQQLSEAQAALESQQQKLDRQQGELEKSRSELVKKETVIAGQTQEIDRLGEDVRLKGKKIEQQQEEIREKDVEIARLDTSLRLLKVDHRLARVRVLDMGDSQAADDRFVTVEFQEVGDEGEPIDEAKRFKLRGDEIRIDCWHVKFDDRYVEQADLDRATSICLFKSIYGNVDGPTRGHSLEEVGSRPAAYARGSKLTEFEKGIWADFWNIANDPEKAQEMGIRAADGQVVYMKARPGKTYQVELRSSGGLSFKPVD